MFAIITPPVMERRQNLKRGEVGMVIGGAILIVIGCFMVVTGLSKK